MGRNKSLKSDCFFFKRKKKFNSTKNYFAKVIKIWKIKAFYKILLFF